ncbi:MAG: permease [Candidatus Sumerlaeia bacterium]|nr:permease [Candidatus Sumerlaeia bacterium]
MFVGAWFLPIDVPRFENAVHESLALTRWYAREHVLLCLVPAFFIAGAIGAFVSQAAVMKYLGARAPKPMAYGVAATSGTLLAVCSCTVLPLFAGVWKRGAGLGPAAAFLYSGPAINILAVILTARVLGLELGVARAVFAIAFSVVIGLVMAWVFARDEAAKVAAAAAQPAPPATRPLWQTATMLGAMTGILIFANWGHPTKPTGLWHAIWVWRWGVTGAFALVLAVGMHAFYGVRRMEVVVSVALVGLAALLFPAQPLVAFIVGTIALVWMTTNGDAELSDWLAQTWDFAKKILPLLFAGVVVAGLLLGRPGHEGLIPSSWVESALGGNSFAANAFASVAGALMYFATLTEVPILQGLLGAGMGKGPALALLLAGPALSLPNMIVIRSVMGTKKTLVFVGLVVVLATVSGLLYGALFG